MDEKGRSMLLLLFEMDYMERSHSLSLLDIILRPVYSTISRDEEWLQMNEDRETDINLTAEEKGEE